MNSRVYRDLGTVNGTKVFHALSEMGSGGPGATQQTVDKGIRALNPGAVIAVGIAFGIDEKKQAIGDILLSKQLRPYNLQRVGKEIILRDDKPHASTRLINFFEGVAQTSWQGSRVHPGVILTGEKLVDNLDYRDQLTRFEPEAVGGEMEGAGLYVASHDQRVDWIVIKAICDWADGQKAKNKPARQRKAARNAAEFLMHALQQAPLKRQGLNSPKGETKVDLATITAAISAVTSAVGLIDKIADQIDRFMTKSPEPAVPKEHRLKIEKEGDEIVSKYHGQELQRITAQDLQKLPEATLRHIKVLEQAMENHYSIWAAVYPQLALALDPIAKAKTGQQLKGIVVGMKGDLEGVLRFLEDSGLHLDDHYMHIRDVVRSA